MNVYDLGFVPSSAWALTKLRNNNKKEHSQFLATVHGGQVVEEYKGKIGKKWSGEVEGRGRS